MFRRKPKRGTKSKSSALPLDLAELGFHFTEKGGAEEGPTGIGLPPGRLVNTATGEAYAYDHSDREASNLLAEALHVAASRHLKSLFERDLGLVPIRLPLDAKDDEPYTTVYASKVAVEEPDKLLVLVPGNHVLFGIWSRRVLFDDSVFNGSMYAYIERAINNGFSVLVCNNNENFVHKDGRRGPLCFPDSPSAQIPGSETPENHLETVFDAVIKKCRAKKVYVVANSYGGHCVVRLLNARFDDGVKERFKAICFTDSVHSGASISSNDVKDWFKTRAVNWVVSEQKAGSYVKDGRFACACAASGTGAIGYSTKESIDGIFKFFAAMDGDPSGINPLPQDLDFDSDSEDEGTSADAAVWNV